MLDEEADRQRVWRLGRDIEMPVTRFMGVPLHIHTDPSLPPDTVEMRGPDGTVRRFNIGTGAGTEMAGPTARATPEGLLEASRCYVGAGDTLYGNLAPPGAPPKMVPVGVVQPHAPDLSSVYKAPRADYAEMTTEALERGPGVLVAEGGVDCTAQWSTGDPSDPSTWRSWEPAADYDRCTIDGFRDAIDPRALLSDSCRPCRHPRPARFAGVRR